jgi:hypothetical protein
MGLVEDLGLKVAPKFEMKPHNSKKQRSSSSGIIVLSEILVLSGGKLNLYYLIKEADSNFYFRLQRSFEDYINNVIMFSVIDKDSYLCLDSQGNFFTAFCDVLSSTNIVSCFKKVKIQEELGKLLLVKDKNNVLIESFKKSFKFLKKGQKCFVMTDGFKVFNLMNLAEIIIYLESKHEWNLAYSILEKIHKNEESRFYHDKSLNIVAVFKDLIDSYLEYCVGNAAIKRADWIECLYRVSYFSKEFSLQNEILLKIKEKCLENNLVNDYFDCLSNLIQDGVITQLHHEELQIVIEYFQLKDQFTTIKEILLNLDFHLSEKDKIISICYDLNIFEPLIKIFINNSTKPDYFSCLNILYRKFQSNFDTDLFKTVMNILEKGLEKVLTRHYDTEKLEIYVMEQITLWLFDDTILSSLISFDPQTVYRTLEKFFVHKVYDLIEKSKSGPFKDVKNFYKLPNVLYDKVKSLAFKSVGNGNDEDVEKREDLIIQNFLYFSLKLSLKPKMNFATNDIILFLSSLNLKDFVVYDEKDNVEAYLTSSVSKFSKNMTKKDFKSLLESAHENNL